MAIDFREHTDTPSIDFAQTPDNLPPENPSFLSKAKGAFDNFSMGVAKGELSTLKGLGTIGQTVLDQTAGRAVNAALGKGWVPTGPDNTVADIYRPGTPRAAQAEQFVTPEGTAQNIGFGTERLAEILLPAAKAAKAETAINAASKAITSPALAATARIAGKAAVQAGTAGAMEFVHTGGQDMGKVGTAAATAGIFRAGMATIGEGARAINLPERLYSTIFKNTASDMMTELKTQNLVDLYNTDPEKYAQFVKQGIIQNTPGGPVLNETIAKQALDMGLRGSIRNMAKTVIGGTLDSESAVRTTLQNYNGTVDLSEKQFYNVLKGIQQEYQDVGFNEISDEAGRLAGAIKSGKGAVSGLDALDIRRLLDKARIASSYEKPPMSMSLTQANLKTLADAARSRLNSIPGMKDIMSKYSFYIDAMDTLAKEAARRGNTQALSLIDSLFLSSAFGGNNAIPGVTAGMFRKYVMSGPGVTGLGQMLNKGTIGPGASTAIQAGASGLANLLIPQKQ